MWMDQDEHDPTIIKAALREAVLSGKLNFRYIDRILFEWKKNGIKTIEQAQQHAKSFAKTKESKNNHINQPFRFIIGLNSRRKDGYMLTKQQIRYCLDEIATMFPNAHCELVHRNPFELLIAVVLSAQCTDALVNKVTKQLFEKYKTPEDYVSVPLEELQQDIRSIGLYRNKAKNIQQLCRILIEQYDGNVPQSREELMKLPGVGRKTANVVVSVAFGVPAIAVDTHVERVSKRIGICRWKDSVLEVEETLMRKIPKEEWSVTHHRLIFLGAIIVKHNRLGVTHVHFFIFVVKEKTDEREDVNDRSENVSTSALFATDTVDIDTLQPFPMMMKHVPFYYDITNEEKPWQQKERALPAVFQLWEEEKRELAPLFAKRQAKQAKDGIIRGISYFYAHYIG